ncbi:hypothetical protein [Paracoccus sp. SCSIO 75233]|uniref:hypothetical protein n=1 Tax=Paracoccus sp. SCSIO 75233 TaxID=3017782 RepID=UPI0022EFF00F|nr:hypothetical protein [Paracoccus sp. SCSIO 75233]WBU54427.1 hypothetical protein PAF12_06225 [Paracoccus sp. SCSIO 75233]
MNWGILAPDSVVSLRRQQSLGLAAAVRFHNDSAVPGLGGMWFAMPILWSVLAVAIAEEQKRPTLPVGNAVEALMMRDAIGPGSDPRVRGARKLQDVDDWSFQNLSRRGTYVMQPIRMAMVQPLAALGFVEGGRYGAFRIGPAGRRMLDQSVMKGHHDVLAKWVRGDKRPKGLSSVRKQLSATAEVPRGVRNLIYTQLQGGSNEGAARRRNLIALGRGPSAQQLEGEGPLSGIAPDHWRDLRGGVGFMDLRDAALAVLDRIEKRLREMRDANESVRLTPDDAAKHAEQEIEHLQSLARRKGPRIAATEEPVSCTFLTEIESSRKHDLMEGLAKRDASVITLRDGHLTLGPAAGEGLVGPGENDGQPADENDVFAPQLSRLYNLHCLAQELRTGRNPRSPVAGDA